VGKKIIILHILCIAVCGFLVYGNSLRGEFIWDDFAYVKDNPHIKDWAFLPGLFSESVGAGAGVRSSFYRPVQMVSYMADYSVWKLDVFGYHLTNTLLHIVASICLYWLLCLVLQRPVLAVITAVLYVVHPVHFQYIPYESLFYEGTLAVCSLNRIFYDTCRQAALGIPI
jgi:protein O-mannosyl-transferase